MKTLIGLGFEPVDVHYCMDDGNIYGMSVWFKGIDVTGLLSQQQYDDLEIECYANERELEIARAEA
jgi:hypothetical protein